MLLDGDQGGQGTNLMPARRVRDTRADLNAQAKIHEAWELEAEATRAQFAHAQPLWFEVRAVYDKSTFAEYRML